MVRNYVRKTVTAYKPEDLSAALAACRDSEQRKSIREIAKEYNVPRNTTMRRLKDTSSSPVGIGRSTVLPLEHEKYLVEAICYSAELGWPITKDHVIAMVQSYVKKRKIKTPFKDHKPGADWYRGFLSRHKKSLSVRKPETVTKARAQALTQQTVDTFFSMLERKVTELKIQEDPSRYYNLDETGLSTNANLYRMLFKRGSKDAQKIQPTEGKAQTTVMFCANAAGKILPPYVVYKAKALHSSWMTNGPPGTVYNCTKSGWMESYVFESWLTSVFVPSVDSQQKPIILLFDGHGSHLTYSSVVAAKAAQIEIICLPPNTTGALQPLDVAVFKGMKSEWRKIVNNFYWETHHTAIKKEHFPTLLNKLFRYMTSHPGSVVNGFAKCGIYPLDKTRIPEGKMILSQSFTESTSQEELRDEAGPSSSTSLAALDTEPSLETQDNNSSPVIDETPIRIANTFKPDIQLTPKSAMRAAVKEVLAPKMSSDVKSALDAAKKKRKRIQRKDGECLTEEIAMERLKRKN